MRVLPAVIVVDMGRGQQRAGGLRFVREAFAQVGVAGIECQGKLGMGQVMEKLGQIGHPAAGMHAGRHVFDADETPGPRA